jgi:proline iminopeptidase
MSTPLSGPYHVQLATSGTLLPLSTYSFKIPDGHSITYTVSGVGPLLIAQAPGWGIGIHYINFSFERLTTSRTLLCIVPRGTLPSTRPADESKMKAADMAHDIEALRVHLSLDTIPALMGHSHGAAIALAYAAAYPPRVEKLLLASPQLIGKPSSTVERRIAQPRWAFARDIFMSIGGITNDATFRSRLAALMPYYFHDPDHPAVSEWQAMVTSTESAPGWAGLQIWPFMAQSKADREDTTGPDLGAVTAKTIICAGEDDGVCGPEWWEAIKGGVRQSKLVVFKDCGHMLWIEGGKDGEEFWKAFIGFLEE